MLNFGTKITSNVNFNLDDITKEEIVLTVRKHFITYLYNIITHLLGILIFSATYLGAHYFNGALVIAVEYFSVFILFVIWTSLFYFLTLQYFDVWIVARDHLIAVDQKEVFNREVAILRLDKIQDISYKKQGILASILNYGDITVQTAGIEQVFTIKCVGKVEEIAQELTRLRDEYHVIKPTEEMEVKSM